MGGGEDERARATERRSEGSIGQRESDIAKGEERREGKKEEKRSIIREEERAREGRIAWISHARASEPGGFRARVNIMRFFIIIC